MSATLSVAVGLSASQANAVIVQWKPGVIDFWDVNSNWIGGAKPTFLDDAHIDFFGSPAIDFTNEVARDVYIGNSNTGELVIQFGGTLTSNVNAIGFNPGATGSALVFGAGSEWNAFSVIVGCTLRMSPVSRYSTSLRMPVLPSLCEELSRLAVRIGTSAPT